MSHYDEQHWAAFYDELEKIANTRYNKEIDKGTIKREDLGTEFGVPYNHERLRNSKNPRGFTHRLLSNYVEPDADPYAQGLRDKLRAKQLANPVNAERFGADAFAAARNTPMVFSDTSPQAMHALVSANAVGTQEANPLGHKMQLDRGLSTAQAVPQAIHGTSRASFGSLGTADPDKGYAAAASVRQAGGTPNSPIPENSRASRAAERIYSRGEELRRLRRETQTTTVPPVVPAVAAAAEAAPSRFSRAISSLKNIFRR